MDSIAGLKTEQQGFPRSLAFAILKSGYLAFNPLRLGPFPAAKT